MFHDYQFSYHSNTLGSNNFHSDKNFLFSSAKPRNFDGMLGTYWTSGVDVHNENSNR